VEQRWSGSRLPNLVAHRWESGLLCGVRFWRSSSGVRNRLLSTINRFDRLLKLLVRLSGELNLRAGIWAGSRYSPMRILRF